MRIMDEEDEGVCVRVCVRVYDVWTCVWRCIEVYVYGHGRVYDVCRNLIVVTGAEKRRSDED